MFFTLAAAVLAAILIASGYYLIPILWSNFRTPLRHLPGPPTASLFWGNSKLIEDADISALQDKWVAQYGHTITFKGSFGVRILEIYAIYLG